MAYVYGIHILSLPQDYRVIEPSYSPHVSQKLQQFLLPLH